MKFCGVATGFIMWLVFRVGRSLPCRHLVPLRCERGSLISASQMRKSRPELLKVTCTLVQWELCWELLTPAVSLSKNSPRRLRGAAGIPSDRRGAAASWPARPGQKMLAATRRAGTAEMDDTHCQRAWPEEISNPGARPLSLRVGIALLQPARSPLTRFVA